MEVWLWLVVLNSQKNTVHKTIQNINPLTWDDIKTDKDILIYQPFKTFLSNGKLQATNHAEQVATLRNSDGDSASWKPQPTRCQLRRALKRTRLLVELERVNLMGDFKFELFFLWFLFFEAENFFDFFLHFFSTGSRHSGVGWWGAMSMSIGLKKTCKGCADLQLTMAEVQLCGQFL